MRVTMLIVNLLFIAFLSGCQHLVDVDEGVDPDLRGGGGVVMVLLEDEHLR